MAKVVSLTDYRKKRQEANDILQLRKDAIEGMRECLKFFHLEEDTNGMVPALRSLVMANYHKFRAEWVNYPVGGSAGGKSPKAKIYLWSIVGEQSTNAYISLSLYSCAMGQLVPETASGLPTWVITGEPPFILGVNTAWPSAGKVHSRTTACIDIEFVR